jgi:hypothetical protein
MSNESVEDKLVYYNAKPHREGEDTNMKGKERKRERKAEQRRQ